MGKFDNWKIYFFLLSGRELDEENEYHSLTCEIQGCIQQPVIFTGSRETTSLALYKREKKIALINRYKLHPLVVRDNVLFFTLYGLYIVQRGVLQKLYLKISVWLLLLLLSHSFAHWCYPILIFIS